MFFSLSPFAPEDSVSRDGFGCPVPCQPCYLLTQVESGAYPWDSFRFRRRCPFHLHREPPSGQRQLDKSRATAYRWRSLPKIRRCRASINRPLGSSSNGGCLFRYQHESIFVRVSFPSPTICTMDMCDAVPKVSDACYKVVTYTVQADHEQDWQRYGLISSLLVHI